MEQIFKGKTEQELKVLVPIYEKLVKKGLSEEEAKEKAIKSYKFRKKASIFLLVSIAFMVIMLFLPNSSSKEKTETPVTKEIQQIISSMTPFRQSANAFDIFEQYYYNSGYEMTDLQEPKKEIIGDIEYDNRWSVAYFEKKEYIEAEKLNLTYYSRLAYQDDGICTFNITVRNVRPEDRTKKLFDIVKDEFENISKAFTDSDFNMIINSIDEAQTTMKQYTKYDNDMSVEVFPMPNEVSVTISVEGN